tara:strand:- start:1817 stop:2092 length:276 start_codon:yes stop_codon:yes gene_type:complete
MTDYSKVPGSEAMRAGVERYIEKGVIPGDFLQAVIANNLLDAVRRADSQNIALLPEWARFFWNEAPPACWLSRKSMIDWADAGGLQGLGAA